MWNIQTYICENIYIYIKIFICIKRLSRAKYTELAWEMLFCQDDFVDNLFSVLTIKNRRYFDNVRPVRRWFVNETRNLRILAPVPTDNGDIRDTVQCTGKSIPSWQYSLINLFISCFFIIILFISGGIASLPWLCLLKLHTYKHYFLYLLYVFTLAI